MEEVPVSEIVKHYENLVNYVCATARLPKEEALDIVHDSVIAAYDSIEQFDRDKGDFVKWLYGIVTNKIRQSYRKKKSRDTIIQVESRPEEKAFQHDLEELIRKSIAALPDIYQQTVELRYKQGMKVQDIAKKLNVPTGTVKARLSRAHDILKSYLGLGHTTIVTYLNLNK